MKSIKEVVRRYPMRIPAFYLGLMDQGNPRCPLRRMAVPSPEELFPAGADDPLDESRISATPILLRRYPGRALFLATNQCALYCRFCNRKRLVGKAWASLAHWEESFALLEKDGVTREVILSGGDPLTLPPDALAYAVDRIGRAPSVGLLRVSTRLPVVSPGDLTENLLEALKASLPLWVVIHINHPREISPEFRENVRRLRDSGHPLVSQTVLLRGVNDCPKVLGALFEGLIRLGIKPYYLFQLDEVAGAHHFKVQLDSGIRIMRYLRQKISGLAVPRFVMDLTGGLGKVPVESVDLSRRRGAEVRVRSLQGKTGTYSDDGKRSRCMGCGICGKMA